MLACGIAGVMMRTNSILMVGFVVATLVLQWVDLDPWRGRISHLVENPTESVFGNANNVRRVESLMREVGAVVLIPPVGCSSAGWDYTSPLNAAAMEIQYMAARANARMRHPYLARAVQTCDQLDPWNELRVLVILHDSGVDLPQRDRLECNDYGQATVCVLAPHAD